DNCGMSAVEERVEVGEVRMPVVPADELGGADDAMQVLARNAKLAVMRRTRGEDHRVVEIEQLGDGDVAPDCDVADEVDTCSLGSLVVALGDGLQRLVVGGDA